eukprot:1159510-Pelagomonas_calceolata.AAC.1
MEGPMKGRKKAWSSLVSLTPAPTAYHVGAGIAELFCPVCSVRMTLSWSAFLLKEPCISASTRPAEALQFMRAALALLNFMPASYDKTYRRHREHNKLTFLKKAFFTRPENKDLKGSAVMT